MIGWISSLNLHHLSSANQINAPCWTCPGCVKIVYQLKKLNVKDLLGVNPCHAVKPLTAPKPSNTGHRYKTKPSSFNAHEADFTGWSRVHRRLIEKSSFTRLINAGLENGPPPPSLFMHSYKNWKTESSRNLPLTCFCCSATHKGEREQDTRSETTIWPQITHRTRHVQWGAAFSLNMFLWVQTEQRPAEDFQKTFNSSSSSPPINSQGSSVLSHTDNITHTEHAHTHNISVCRY